MGLGGNEQLQWSERPEKEGAADVVDLTGGPAAEEEEGWYAAGTRDGPLSIAAFTGGLGALEERKELRTTHGRVWYGAQLMIQYLEQAQGVLGLRREGLRVLELGSGTGWLGLNLAARLPGASVTLTDLDRAVPELAAHVDRAAAALPELGLQGRVRSEAADWAELGGSALAAEPWDLVLGTDLLYSHEALAALCTGFAALVSERPEGSAPPRLLYAHVPGRKASVDAAWAAHLAAAGLALHPAPQPPP